MPRRFVVAALIACDGHAARESLRRYLTTWLLVFAVIPWSERSLAASSSSTVPSPEVSQPAHFAIDPIGDSAVIVASGSFGALLELIIRTGELRPQAPIDPSLLLPIDRQLALSDEVEIGARIGSDLVALSALGYAVFDSIACTWADRGDTAVTYGVIYAETVLLNLAVGNLVKIAVRRPRPTAFAELRRTGQVSAETNSALSFYSDHTAFVAALTATGTYLAFTRDDSQLQGWLTLAGGAMLTALVGYQRVNARAHFPTDVIAGGLAGAALGVLVPHLHRVEPTSRALSLLQPIIAGGGLGIAIAGAW
jgi:membrane-associated phospholipid phosphatase